MPDLDPRTSMVDAMSTILQASTGRVEGVVVAKVASFSRSEQTVDVDPQVERDGVLPPRVCTVPVLFPGAYWDIQVDTFGVLLVGGLNWRRWWRTGQAGAPEDGARHELTNGLFLPGLVPQDDPRDLDSGTTVLLRPRALGQVRLGTYDAAKAAVHEDALTDILAWASAVSVAITALGGDVTGALVTLGANLPTRKSPSVMVED